MSSCCSPGVGVPLGHHTGRRADDAPSSSVPWSPDAGLSLVPLRGGTFAMGSESDEAVPGDGEGPVRDAVVAPFAIDAHCVSNERFAAFVDATGHVTDAERFGWSFVFEGFLPAPLRDCDRAAGAPWWAAVPGASGGARRGPGSRPGGPRGPSGGPRLLAGRLAYCAWAAGPAAHRGRVGVRRPRRPATRPATRGATT